MSTKKTAPLRYCLMDLDDKCLVLKVDFSISWSEACEVIAVFSLNKKPLAEKLIQELNAGKEN